MDSEPMLHNWYVYRHIRLDKNTPFYIGIGCSKNYSRAYSTNSRNKRWFSIIKNIEYAVEILFENLTKTEAISKEKEFIQIYRRESFGGILCNQTDGGEGIHNRQDIEKWKANLSIAAKNMSEEHKKKISDAKIGKPSNMKGKKLTEEQKNKISLKIKGISKSSEHKDKLRKINLGKKLSEETKQKIKLWNLNIGHSFRKHRKNVKSRFI
jgi:hypothetical protein